MPMGSVTKMMVILVLLAITVVTDGTSVVAEDDVTEYRGKQEVIGVSNPTKIAMRHEQTTSSLPPRDIGEHGGRRNKKKPKKTLKQNLKTLKMFIEKKGVDAKKVERIIAKHSGGSHSKVGRCVKAKTKCKGQRKFRTTMECRYTISSQGKGNGKRIESRIMFRFCECENRCNCQATMENGQVTGVALLGTFHSEVKSEVPRSTPEFRDYLDQVQHEYNSYLVLRSYFSDRKAKQCPNAAPTGTTKKKKPYKMPSCHSDALSLYENRMLFKKIGIKFLNTQIQLQVGAEDPRVSTLVQREQMSSAQLTSMLRTMRKAKAKADTAASSNQNRIGNK